MQWLKPYDDVAAAYSVMNTYSAFLHEKRFHADTSAKKFFMLHQKKHHKKISSLTL